MKSIHYSFPTKKTRRRYSIEYKLNAIAECEAANETFEYVPGGNDHY